MEQVARENIEILNAEHVLRQLVARTYQALAKLSKLIFAILTGLVQIFFGRSAIDVQIEEARNKYRDTGYHLM